MHVSANLTVHQRDERLAEKHVPQSDAKKRSILFDALGSEGRDVEGVAYERLGENGDGRVQVSRRVLLNDQGRVHPVAMQSNK